MEFYQLEAFVSVAAERSFSRAAEQLYLSQPTVSAHIKSLEKELGTSLFDRGKTELKLTGAGSVLYRFAREMLALRLSAVDSIRDSSEIGEEALTVAASSVPCQYLLPRAIAAFKELHNRVNIKLTQKNSKETCEDVFNYHVPVGVVGEKIKRPHLEFAPLLEDELVVAVPHKQHYSELLAKESVSLNDLSGHKMLLREPGSGTRSHFESELVKANASTEMFQVTIFDNQETIKQAVRQGLGLTVISRYVVSDYLQFGILATRSITDLNLKRSFYLVSHSKRILSPASKALLDHLKTFPWED
ncbi:selenium metabolism-associated LysR family transcriptional regulator [Dethiobacter alkaliphilus]|uniref:Transcriptional regulator, LysR family n=1 Tax=Dethiobacter alkaliphilus AHT 1 TaxID=555088 RepID=C0GDQ1_DETAL|nr:selenium metabolism-associated LysR family transcriptional regulator [Dethiobacter alkaliphilus]EEG78534.1 transcriptional regulator, LysR family [Dethiobacter alkaliphilus AHT 1]